MKTLKTILVFSLCLMAWEIEARPVKNSHPLRRAELRKLENRSALRDQMSQMVINMADLDILINRDKNLDYELFEQDGLSILHSLSQIRKLDTAGFFVNYLNAVEDPARKLVSASKRKNRKALEYFEQMNQACFSCHRAHRDKKANNLKMESARLN